MSIKTYIIYLSVGVTITENTSRPEENGRYIADIFTCIILKDPLHILQGNDNSWLPNKRKGITWPSSLSYLYASLALNES